MKARVKAILMALGFMALAATAAFAQPGFMGGGGPQNMGGPPGGGPHMEGELGGLARVLGALELTDDQRSEIGEIMDEARFEIQSIRESFQDINPREELMELFIQEDLSLLEVEAVFDDIDEVQEQVRDVMLEAFVEIHDVLTVDQLERLAELIEMRAGMGGHEMGTPMGGPGMGGHNIGGPPPGGNNFGF